MCSSSVNELRRSLDIAVRILNKGGVVAFPTETYYGLAVDPYCASAVDKLFRLKKRKAEKPLLLLIENKEQLNTLAESVPLEYAPLIDKYWPGPLTLVFTAKNNICGRLTGGGGTIGIRISPHPVAKALLEKMGKPLTATSANISGQRPAKSAAEVEKIFGSSIDYIIDGGDAEAGLCSTIVSLKENKLTILRDGQVDLKNVFGKADKR